MRIMTPIQQSIKANTIKATHSVESFLRSMNYSLHVGNFFGAFTKTIWFITSLAMVLFIYTGLYSLFEKTKKEGFLIFSANL